MNDRDHPVMIETESLTKVYGALKAISDITFSCKKGEVVGFLGPNGAGKTTTMRILTGYMPPTSGAAYIAGHNTLTESLPARQRLGYLPETVPLYPELSVENYLAFVGRVRRVDNLWDRVDAVLQTVDLLDRAESYISTLSKGMRQRVGLAQALLHDPDVLILDEPTIGLDPAQIREVRQLITQLGEKHTILLSTHILSEVEQICSRAIIVIDGRIWADMPIEQAVGGAHKNLLTVKLARPAANTLTTLRAVQGVVEARANGVREFQVRIDGRDETRQRVAETAVNSGWGLLELSSEKVSLETIFLNKLQEAEQAALDMAEEVAAETHPKSTIQNPKSLGEE
ncbi:MAG: ABC transporter ATP-binding protein [Chloroflexota bacterium]